MWQAPVSRPGAAPGRLARAENSAPGPIPPSAPPDRLFGRGPPGVIESMNACCSPGDTAMGSPRQSDFAAHLPAVGLHHSCCREILKLNQENARLAGELARLR